MDLLKRIRQKIDEFCFICGITCGKEKLKGIGKFHRNPQKD